MGVYALPHARLIEVRGPQALSFLQTQASQDILKLNMGEGAFGAILDRTGKIQTLFSFYRLGLSGWLLTHNDTAAVTIQAVEKYHITEDFSIIDQGESFSLLAVQGPLAPGLLARQLNVQVDFDNMRVVQCKCAGVDVAAFSESLCGERGVVLAVARQDEARIRQTLLDSGASLGAFSPTPAAQRILRLEAGLLQFGAELNSHHLLPGTGLEASHVSYDKGCYIGQEIVARMRAYERAPRFLIGAVVLEGGVEASQGVLTDGVEDAGEMLASYPMPGDGRTAVILLLRKKLDIHDSRVRLQCAGRALLLELRPIPFHDPALRRQKARALYGEALHHFSETDATEAEDNRAIELLQQSLELNPGFSDACEVLGVLLGRKGRYSEAIACMHTLADVDPLCVMAQSNLSLYYMKVGDIEKAEKHKAEATALQFKSAAAQARGKKKQGEMEQAQRDDLERKKRLFQEVLTLDAADVPALFGLGRCHLELGEAEAAVPHLSKVIAIKPDYSAAYLQLGKCQEAQGLLMEAVQTYKTGIGAAQKRGDLLPLKEMEQRLYKLTQAAAEK